MGVFNIVSRETMLRCIAQRMFHVKHTLDLSRKCMCPNVDYCKKFISVSPH